MSTVEEGVCVICGNNFPKNGEKGKLCYGCFCNFIVLDRLAYQGFSHIAMNVAEILRKQSGM